MEQETKAPASPFWLYGAIIGGVGVVMNLVFYVTGIIAKGWPAYLALLFMFGALIGTLFMYRAEHLGGYAYYKQYLKVSILSVLLAFLINSLFWFLMITLIDSTILEQQKQEGMRKIPKTIERVEKFTGGMTEEQRDEAIDAAIEQLENRKMMNVPWINALVGFFGTFITFLPFVFLAPVFAIRKRPEGGPPINQTV